MSPYQFSLNDPQWRKKSYRIRRERGWRCEHCGYTNPEKPWDFAAHHLTRIPGKRAADYSDADLIVLCHYCHETQHRRIRHSPGQVELFTHKELGPLLRTPRAMYFPGRETLH